MRCWPSTKAHRHFQTSYTGGLPCTRNVTASKCAAVSCRYRSVSYVRAYQNCAVRTVRETRPRLPFHRPFHSSRKRREELQYSKTVQEPATTNDTRESRTITHDIASLDDHARSLDQIASDLSDQVVEVLKHVRARVRSPDQLFSVIAKYVPSATPMIQVDNLSFDQDKGNTVADSNPLEPAEVKIANSTHGLEFSQMFDPSEHTQESLERLFGDTAWRFTMELITSLKAGNIPALVDSSLSYDQILSQLELGPLSVSCIAIEGANSLGEHLQFYRANAYVGQEAIGFTQTWTNQLTAERLARASAKAEILRRAEQANIDLTMLEPPQTAKKKPVELPRARILDEPRVYDASISHDCLSAMLSTMRRVRDAHLPDEITVQPLEHTKKPYIQPKHQRARLEELSLQMVWEQAKMPISPQLKVMRKKQSKLPIRSPQTSAKILDLIEKNDVVVLVSETGSGKTTQLPQLLLEKAIQAGRGAMCDIVCTQPRRIAATSVARRVAQERDTYVGGTVGYQVRFDHRVPTEPGKITYATAGVLLKALQEDDDRIFSQHCHIVVDEVHERDLTVDLLMAVLRESMRTRKLQGKPFPKIILMSATMDTAHFENFFTQTTDGFNPKVATITVPGRTYPVTPVMLDKIIPMLSRHYANDRSMTALLEGGKSYLEIEDRFLDLVDRYGLKSDDPSNELDEEVVQKLLDDNTDPWEVAEIPYVLIVATIAHILKAYSNGDILVFLPGMREIETVAARLTTQPPLDLDFTTSDKIRIFKLHAALYETNAKVFEPVPKGTRRVILATNIAQTSITLPQVTHVIDCGKQRMMIYDQKSRQNDFLSGWIDQATSLQRRGRAGRVQHGYYWAMFTDTRFQMMSKTAKPDILISDLVTSSLVLKSYVNDIDLHRFFADTLDAPQPDKVTSCVEELQGLGMLTRDGKITPLGSFCSEFPLHPAAARGLLLGLMFQCFTPMMLTACHDPTSPIVYSSSNRREMHQASLAFSCHSDDDRHIAIQAFMEYDEAVRSGDEETIEALEHRCVKREIYRTMNSVANQLYGILCNDYDVFRSGEKFMPVDRYSSLWRGHDNYFEQHSNRISLFKALALTVCDTNLAVWDEREQAWLAEDVLCMLKPYGINTKQSLKMLERHHLRGNGELVAYSGLVRNVLASRRPALVDTSRITPLTAMLFGGSVAVVEPDVVEIDGWLRYRINVPSPHIADLKLDGSESVKIILELRKMIDRYLALVCSDLTKVSALSPLERKKRSFNKHIVPNEMQSRLASGLCDVLAEDAKHWDEVLYLGSGVNVTKGIQVW